MPAPDEELLALYEHQPISIPTGRAVKEKLSREGVLKSSFSVLNSQRTMAKLGCLVSAACSWFFSRTSVQRSKEVILLTRLR